MARMEYRKLGRSGLRVSPLCLGTMNFGPQADEATSFAIMDRALELGINFFDTANVYGGKKGEGVTEQIVGRWLAQGGGRREQIVLATKVYGRMGDRPNENLLSAYHLRRACDESLRRLKTDHIDLYQMHHVDRSTPWDEIWQAMEQLVARGQGDLCRKQQLRRLASGAGARYGGPPQLPRSGVGAEPLQPERAHDRARSGAGMPRTRARAPPVEPARRRPPHDRRRPHRQRPARDRPSGESGREVQAAPRRVHGALPRSRRRPRPTWRSPGSSPIRWSPRPSSDRAPWSSSRIRCARSTSRSPRRS